MESGIDETCNVAPSKFFSNSDDIDSGTEVYSDSGHSSDEERSDFSESSLDIDLKSTVEKNLKTKDVKPKTNRIFDLGFDIPLDLMESRDYLRRIVEGFLVEVDYSISVDTKPDWYDEDKFKAGQKFAQSHAFCINFAEMLSLYMIFACKGALEPLIFSNKSHTPFLAFKRYLSTYLRVKSWYEEDPWDPNSKARANILAVRGMHRQVEKQLNQTTPEELREKVTLGNEEEVGLWCPMKDKLSSDFQKSCTLATSSCPFATNTNAVWMSQSEMAGTQFAFVGLLIAYPEKFGCEYVTDEELESFIHLWRVIGYMLGTKDEYNFCNGSLSEVRSRSRDYCEYMMKPSLRRVDSDWEHMCRCMTEGIGYYIEGTDFEVSLLYLCDVLNMDSPGLRASLSYSRLFTFYALKLMFRRLLTFRPILDLFNSVLKKAVSEAVGFSEHKLNTLKNKKYSYSEQSGKVKLK